MAGLELNCWRLCVDKSDLKTPGRPGQRGVSTFCEFYFLELYWVLTVNGRVKRPWASTAGSKKRTILKYARTLCSINKGCPLRKLVCQDLCVWASSGPNPPGQTPTPTPTHQSIPSKGRGWRLRSTCEVHSMKAQVHYKTDT